MSETVRPALRERLAATLLLALLAAKLIHAAWVLPPTFDEYKHSMTGYAYLASGVCCWGLSDTAMVGLYGVPWVVRGRQPVTRPTPGTTFQEGEPGDLRPPVHRDNTLARLPTVVLCVLLAWLVMRMARKLGGAAAGLLAGVLFLASPNLAAHGSLVSTDFQGAFGIFVATAVFYRAVRRGMGREGLFLAAAGFALAQIAKYSALVLLAALPLIALAGSPPGLRAKGRAIAWTAGVFAIGFALVASIYELPRLIGGLGIPLLLEPERWTLPSGAPLPTGYLGGMALPRAMARHGVVGYYHGEFGTAWPAFYPIVTLLKTPIGLLALVGAGLAVAVRRPIPLAGRLACLAPPALLFVPSCFSRVTLALRYILPVWPFLMVLGGLAAAGPWIRWRLGRLAVGLLAVWALVSGFRDHPFELAYVNELAGGPRQAVHWFADANLDWGQGLAALAKEVRERGIERVALSYHGSISPDRYQIPWVPLDPDHEVRGWVAISLTHLIGMYYPRAPDCTPEAFAWLRDREPVAILGGSILLFRID